MEELSRDDDPPSTGTPIVKAKMTAPLQLKLFARQKPTARSHDTKIYVCFVTCKSFIILTVPRIMGDPWMSWPIKRFLVFIFVFAVKTFSSDTDMSDEDSAFAIKSVFRSNIAS